MAQAALCVSCRRRPAEPRYRPFCSERCRMAELGRWLGGEYRIAGPSAGDQLEPPTPLERPGAPDDAEPEA